MRTHTFGHRKQVRHFDNGEPHFRTLPVPPTLTVVVEGLFLVDWFVQALTDVRKVHGFHLWAWVIMPEHVHLLIWPPISQIATHPASSKGRISAVLADI